MFTYLPTFALSHHISNHLHIIWLKSYPTFEAQLSHRFAMRPQHPEPYRTSQSALNFPVYKQALVYKSTFKFILLAENILPYSLWEKLAQLHSAPPHTHLGQLTFTSLSLLLLCLVSGIYDLRPGANVLHKAFPSPSSQKHFLPPLNSRNISPLHLF